MKTKSSDVLEIFQDPLLTIIALVLLSTVWMIIPNFKDTHIEEYITQVRDDVNKLDKELAEIKKRISELKKEAEILNEKLQRLENLLEEAKKNGLEKKKIDKILYKVIEQRGLIKQKNEELERLEKKLEEAMKKVEEGKIIEKLIQDLRKIKEELKTRKSLLKRFKDEYRRLIEQQERKEKNKREKEADKEKIFDEIDIIEAEIEEKRRELDEIKESNQNLGIGEMTMASTKGKDQFWVEAVDNRILVVNRENYDVNTYVVVKTGEYVNGYTKKSYKYGESIDKIQDSNSDFQKELDDHDSDDKYLVFFLHKDSFEIFKEARAIAAKNGFVTTWLTKESGLIYIGGKGSGKGLPGR